MQTNIELIKTVDLHKSFGKLHVLQGVNETVKIECIHDNLYVEAVY